MFYVSSRIVGRGNGASAWDSVISDEGRVSKPELSRRQAVGFDSKPKVSARDLTCCFAYASGFDMHVSANSFRHS